MTTDMQSLSGEEREKEITQLKERARVLRQQAIQNRDPFYGLQIDPSASYYDEAPEREPGDNNWVGFGFDIHPQVTLTAAILLILFIGGTLLF